MISVRVYVHWLNSNAFTGVVNARHVRVTKFAHRHIYVRNSRQPTGMSLDTVTWTPIKFTHSSRADNTDKP
jgi:hypothetical protein